MVAVIIERLGFEQTFHVSWGREFESHLGIITTLQ